MNEVFIEPLKMYPHLYIFQKIVDIFKNIFFNIHISYGLYSPGAETFPSFGIPPKKNLEARMYTPRTFPITIIHKHPHRAHKTFSIPNQWSASTDLLIPTNAIFSPHPPLVTAAATPESIKTHSVRADEITAHVRRRLRKQKTVYMTLPAAAVQGKKGRNRSHQSRTSRENERTTSQRRCCSESESADGVDAADRPLERYIMRCRRVCRFLRLRARFLRYFSWGVFLCWCDVWLKFGGCRIVRVN